MAGEKESFINEFDSYNSSTDGDGYLTADELKDLNLTTAAQNTIIGYDLNGDKKVSKNEYLFSKLANGGTRVTKGQLIDAYGDAAAQLLSYDENKDGVITAAEVKLGEERAAAANQPSEAESMEDKIAQFDLWNNGTGGDGYLTEQELKDLKTISAEDQKTIMGYDLNGDKKVSKNEYLFAQVLKSGETSVTKGQLIDAYGEEFTNKFLKECDLDGDGKVSRAEIITVEDTKRYNQPTTDQSQNNEQSSGGLSTLSIVLISVAGCMLVGLIIALILLAVDKNSSKESNKRRLHDDITSKDNSVPSSNLTTTYRSQTVDPQ